MTFAFLAELFLYRSNAQTVVEELKLFCVNCVASTQ